MKSMTGFILGAGVLALAGALSLTAARADGHLADAQELMATLRFDEAAASLAAAEESFRYARWVPRVGADAVGEVAPQQAALQYYQGRYADLLPAGDPVASVDENNVPLQFVVANAVVRDKLRPAAAAKPEGPRVDRTVMVQALDEAASSWNRSPLSTVR